MHTSVKYHITSFFNCLVRKKLKNTGYLKKGWLTYVVFKVGQVSVPAQANNINVHDTEFGREVVEVDRLSKRPHTQVNLQARKTKVKQSVQFTQNSNSLNK